MTSASRLALTGLRDVSTLQWYVIPLLAVVFYIYASEIRSARSTGNWNIIVAGLTIFSADFLNETVNGWILNLTGISALWTAPGPTALRTMVGWNIEIMFMFAILGIIYWKTVDDDARVKWLGIPNRWFWAIGYSAFCVFIEVFLNIGGHLVWEYPLWNRNFPGIIPIFIFGYFWFFAAAKFAVERKTLKSRFLVPGTLFLAAIFLNLLGQGFLGFKY